MCQSKNKTSENLPGRKSRQQTLGQVAEIQKDRGRIRLESDLSDLRLEDLLIAESGDVINRRLIASKDVVDRALPDDILNLSTAEGILMG